ncbi:TPA: hypothetical protein P9404_005044, partial [Escherichia coli]|nr:hypothetical protein [Escherichia coli]
MKPNRPLIVILSTVALDAVGIGLIMPVLPGLLRDLVHSNDVTAHYGILRHCCKVSDEAAFC